MGWWWPAQLCNENIKQLTSNKIYLTKYFFPDISQTCQWRSSLQVSPRKRYHYHSMESIIPWRILYNRLQLVTLIRQYFEDWMLRFHELLSLTWRQVVITRWEVRTAITVPAIGVGSLVQCSLPRDVTTIKILYHVPVKSAHLILFQMEIRISWISGGLIFWGTQRLFSVKYLYGEPNIA